MAIKIFSWRHNLPLFIGAFLILGLIPNSVNAFSDEVPPVPISDEQPPTNETETDDPDEEEAETPIDQPENIRPPETEPEPDNRTPVGEIEEPTEGTETTNPLAPPPAIEAGPDINQPNSEESAAGTEGETPIEIPGETGEETTPPTTEETRGDGEPSTSGPAVNPPIEPPSGEGQFSAEVINAVNETAGDIIEQLSSPPGDVGISVGDAGAEGGGGESAVQNIQNILTGSSIDSANLNSLVHGLLQILGAPSREVAEQLVRSLLGLLKDGKVDPRRLWAAINAYNAFIEASSPEFLENPPIELVMIRAILSDLVEAAIAADIRSRN